LELEIQNTSKQALGPKILVKVVIKEIIDSLGKIKAMAHFDSAQRDMSFIF
jgi:hypothetical protein